MGNEKAKANEERTQQTVEEDKAKVEAATQSTKAAQEALHKASAAASSNSACGPDANPNTCMAHMRKMAADFNRYHAKTARVAQTADEKAKAAETKLKDASAASNIATAREESAKTAEN